MKALSIQQPWAWLIIHAGKDIENRVWPTKLRGEILIHAGKKHDREGYLFANDMGIDIPHDEIKTGGIVGKVKIVDCVQQSDSFWFCGPYGFVLEDAQEVEFMPCRGQLSFFEPELISQF